MSRRTIILIADGPRGLRVTVELLPEPITTTGVELPDLTAPAVPREMRDTARPPAKVVTIRPARKECA